MSGPREAIKRPPKNITVVLVLPDGTERVLWPKPRSTQDGGR